MFDNDDDYDFTPIDSSKLSSLFGSPSFQSEETSKHLVYTAPKQPSVSNCKSDTDKPLATKVILLKIVTLWKSEDKTYKPLGKHGLAIIGATDVKVYEIIAYKHKTSTVLRIKINSQFYYQQRRDNFSSFYDNDRQNWLVRFEDNEQQLEFSEQLVLYGGSVIVEDAKPDTLPKPQQDSDSSDSVKKANILNRITKLGQQVVPKPLEVIDSDVSDEFEKKDTTFKKPKKLEKEEDTIIINQIVPRSHVGSSQVYYSGYGDLSSILVAHNSELKTSLNQITEKLDALSVQKKDSNGGLTSRLKVLELRCENLQTELNKYKQKCGDLEKKFFEMSNINAKLREINVKINSSNNKRTISDLEEMVETQKQSLDELNTCCQQYAESNRENLGIISNLKEKIRLYEKKLENANAEKQKILQGNSENVQILSQLVKEKINDMYQSILNNFDPEESYNFNELQNVLTKNLKEASYQIINDIKTKLGDVKDGST